MGWAARANPTVKARMSLIDLYLDDIRPTPDGWLGVTNIADAKLHLAEGRVRKLSLDHDLGACDDCLDGMDEESWLRAHNWEQMPHCEHVGTGYDLCCWMEETGHWPREVPTVHSANPVGAARMRLVIQTKYRKPD